MFYVNLPVGAVALLVVITRLRLPQARSEPILPPRLFRKPVFVVVAITLFLLFAILMFTPLVLQIVVGAMATSAGLLLLPMTIGITASTVVAGLLITKTGTYKHFPCWVSSSRRWWRSCRPGSPSRPHN